MSRFNIVALAIVAGLLICSSSQASIIFDDFNAGAGTHFNGAPQTSGTTNILNTVTTGNLNATTSTTDAFEGGKALNIHIQGNGAATPAGFPRIRFLSGGGTPANNVAFTTTAGTDGWIGFYYKVPAAGTLPSSLPAGLQVQINLDGATTMASGVPINAVMDGAWHLAEWNLDDAPSWQATPGISGDGTLHNESHTIDSIYFRYPTSTGWTGFTGQEDLQLDFVALNPSGSVADLVPEPASLGLLAVGALGLIRRRR